MGLGIDCKNFLLSSIEFLPMALEGVLFTWQVVVSFHAHQSAGNIEGLSAKPRTINVHHEFCRDPMLSRILVSLHCPRNDLYQLTREDRNLKLCALLLA